MLNWTSAVDVEIQWKMAKQNPRNGNADGTYLHLHNCALSSCSRSSTKKLLQLSPKITKLTHGWIVWGSFDFINHPFQTTRGPKLMEKKLTKHCILWFGHCSLGIWSRTFIRLEENSCKSATGYPLGSTKNTDWEVISGPVEVKVPRDHLNHCPASWSKTLTGTTLNVDLDLDLQLRNTLQAFGELWGKPSVQPWDKTWRVRTFLSWVYLSRQRQSKKWDTDVKTA